MGFKHDHSLGAIIDKASAQTILFHLALSCEQWLALVLG